MENILNQNLLGENDKVVEALKESGVEIFGKLIEIAEEIQNDETIPFEAKTSYTTKIAKVFLDVIFVGDEEWDEHSKEFLHHLIGIAKATLKLANKDEEETIGTKLAEQVLDNLDVIYS